VLLPAPPRRRGAKAARGGRARSVPSRWSPRLVEVGGTVARAPRGNLGSAAAVV